MSEDPAAALASAIGKLTIEWNNCQAAVFAMFDSALGTDILMSKAIFFALRSDSSQRDVAAAAIKQAVILDKDFVQKAVEAINEFARIAGRRNDFIHAIWSFPPDNPHGRVFLDIRARLSGKNPAIEAASLTGELETMKRRLWGLDARLVEILAEECRQRERLAQQHGQQLQQTANPPEGGPTNALAIPRQPPR